MALDARTHQEIYNSVFGRTDYEPIVTFFDHATYNEELTKQSGRPRYTETTYTRIKPTHPDLKVRDEVCHPTKEDEKQRYPKQWEAYKKLKDAELEFKPPLQAIPGMKISYFRELQDLNVFNADDLVNYDGDLDELEFLRSIAEKIMEVSREAREVQKRRESVGEDRDRQQQYHSPQPGVITQTGKTLKEEVEEKGNETFSYSFTL
jgi:hypothetical protein